MSFRDMTESDIKSVFLNADEFADVRDVTYDGVTYVAIPAVLTGISEKDRRTLQSDHAQGMYIVAYTMHVALSDIGGRLPEKGAKIRVSENAYFRDFYIASSFENMGLARLELEAIDE